MTYTEIPISVLLMNFREALVALAAICNRSGIPWRDGEAYDEWDNLVTAAYAAFVDSPLQDDSAKTLPLAPYDMRVDSYERYSGIVVGTTETGYLIFNRLKNDDGLFTNLEAVPVSHNWSIIEGSPISLPIDDTVPHFCRRHPFEGARQVQ